MPDVIGKTLCLTWLPLKKIILPFLGSITLSPTTVWPPSYSSFKYKIEV